MVTVVPDVNLTFKEYQASLQQNPSNIFYQRVASRNVSNQQCSFTVSSPNKRSYLLLNGQIEWRFTFNRTNTLAAPFSPDLGTADNYADDADMISLKPVLPVANAMSSITISINGSTNTLAQPRRIMECLSMAHVSRKEAKLHYEAGYPEKMGGTLNQLYPYQPWSATEVDNTMTDQFYEFTNRLLRGTDITTISARTFLGAPFTNNGTIIVTEPIISPPFDCYSKVDKSTMPDWSPWKWMSKVCPNVDRLELDIQFTKLDASIMFYLYGRNATAGRPPAMNILPAGVQANLLLYWTEVPVSTSIPRSLDLQSFNWREFNDDAGANRNNNEPFTTTSSLIQLNSVPSCIITHLERSKDEGNYLPVAATSGTNAPNADPANQRRGDVSNNWDDYAEINTITYLLGDRPNVISATFSQRELYDITVKNCKDYPYTYEDWRGRKRPLYGGVAGEMTAGGAVNGPLQDYAQAWNHYPCKGMVIVTGADIANKTSTGVFSSNSLQVVVNWRPHTGYGGIAGGNHQWQLLNHLVFGAEFLRIESDKSQFQSQSLDEATARRLVDPPLGSLGVPSGTGGALRVGGALQSGGALAPLRNRGVSAIGSRL